MHDTTPVTTVISRRIIIGTTERALLAAVATALMRTETTYLNAIDARRLTWIKF
jgi:hypothetical protein